MIRIGHSFDLHRLEAGKRLVIGGIDIPFDKGLVAVSDGDVLLHALAESMLGALALGDLGTHFPPSDPASEGLDSSLILKTVYDKIKQAGYDIVNIDTMIYAEKPSLKPYKKSMQAHIARLLQIKTTQVSVKATTMERLGPIGHQEAIAASSTILLKASSHVVKL